MTGVRVRVAEIARGILATFVIAGVSVSVAGKERG
jgi:hypothetical protein